MFVLSKSATYSWPVKFDIPSSGGKFEKVYFDAIFKRLQQSEIKKALDSESLTDADFAKRILVGWKGIQDESGEEIPFSESALDDLCEFAGAAKAITVAYIESITGAKAKN